MVLFAQRIDRRRSFWVLLRIWYGRARTRFVPQELDARGLADVGLTEAQRRHECAKWFWWE